MSSHKSPRRKSLADFNLNKLDTLSNVTLPITNKEFLQNHKQNQNGSEGDRDSISSKGSVGFSTGKADTLYSPRTMARRTAKPRKSILKFSASMNEENTTDFTTLNYANTVAFVEPVNRRVSFARNAHVRMFQNPRASEGAGGLKSALRHSVSAPSVTDPSTGPRLSIAQPHSRRASIQNLSAVTQQASENRFIGQGEAEGETSMDIESDEELDSQDQSVISADLGDRRQSGASEGDEGEMDMDETVAYGGILRRQSAVATVVMSPGDASDMSIATATTDEEKTMDFTIAMGGVLPNSPPAHAARNRYSIGYSLPESPSNQGGRVRPGDRVEGDESMDMEETGVYGGVMGEEDETVSTISDQHSVEGRERTMTFSFGDISAAAHAHARTEDQSRVQVQPVEDGEEGMEMTVALGGILQATSPGPQRSTLTSSLTRPSPGASNASYARSTLSSSQRHRDPTPKKRNIFGPSPSPHRLATPRADGMTTAGEVAKRLFFGSATSSAGKKRPAEEDEDSQAGSLKKARPTITKNIFAPPSVDSEQLSPVKAVVAASTTPSPVKEASPVKSTSAGRPRQSIPRNLRTGPSPRKSLNVFTQPKPQNPRLSVVKSPGRFGSPMRVFTPQPEPAHDSPLQFTKSPARSPALRRIMGERVSQEEIDQADAEALEMELEPAMVPLSDFLRMAKVEFMEDLPVSRRRSSVGRGLLGQSYSGAGKFALDLGERVLISDREFTLSDYTEAEVQYNFLTLYNWANRKMRDDIQASKAELEKYENICSLENPPVMREYLAANDEDKTLFENTFKAYKTNVGLAAKENWYIWKKETMDSLKPDVQAMLGDMQEDAQRLETMEKQAEAIIPDLEARLESLAKELEKERLIVQEIAECDQDELADLKAGIAEQATQINGFSAELNDTNSKLETLQAKLDELEQNKKVCEGRINAAKSLCDQYTRSDVLRFKEEYESIQALHSWRIVSLTPQTLDLVYDNQVRLFVPCHAHQPDISSARLEWVAKPIKGKFKHGSEINEGLAALLQDSFKTILKSSRSLVELVQQTGAVIASSQRLRAEVGFMNMRLPVSYRTVDIPTGKGMIITATMVISHLKSKVELCFLMTRETLMRWPGGLAGVEVESRVVYGSADPEMMKRAARDTISEVQDEGYIGALLQACVDAQSVHAR